MKATKGARKLTSILLALSMAASMLITCASAAPSGIQLDLVYPEDVPQESVTVTVYQGYPTSYSNAAAQLEEMEALTPAEDGSLVLPEAGTYSCWVRGDGFYNVCQLFNVTEADAAAGVKELTLKTSRMAYNGYEPSSPDLADVPDGYSQPSDAVIMLWPDEILANFTTSSLKGFSEFKTPFFTNERAQHEFTSQDEMMAFLTEKSAACGDMYTYILGSTPAYHFQMPIAVFTQTDLSSASTLEQAGELVRANGKLNIWIQCQIHPNEPAAGEGALALIDDLTGSYGEQVLKDANILVIPRINPDGSYLFTRTTYQGFDMNRDHMALKAPELAYLHTAYRYFMPEVVADGHEFGFYGVEDGYMRNADDLEVTPASSLNNSAAVNKLAEEVVDAVHVNTTEAGLRTYHYGFTVNNPIGRAYYGLYNSISILIETRGISGGSQNFARRVFSQQQTTHSIIDASIANASEIKSTVAAARAEVIKKGASYREDDVVVLHQTASGKTMSPRELTRYQFSLDGVGETKTSAAALSMNDTVVRSRTRPTAYVIPKDIPNLDKILYILDNQGAEYYELAPGSSAELAQYFYEDAYTYNERELGFTAGLRDVQTVTFEQGAYVIPMDQVAGNVIAMTMEPDVNDSNGYDGTLVQYGIVTYDETTKDFPLYRYIGDDPRTTLVSTEPDTTEPDTTEPDTTEPDTTEPDTTEPDTTKPDTTEPDTTEPDTTEPDTTKPAAGTYTVKTGDCLWNIARSELGSGSRWEEIYQLNRDSIRNPNQIQVGQVLVLPGK